MTYAIGGTQSADLLQRYKNHPVRAVRERHRMIVNWLLWLGITLHERYIARAVGLPVSRRLVIPSLTRRPGRHPSPNSDATRKRSATPWRWCRRSRRCVTAPSTASLRCSPRFGWTASTC
jgi:hypothetical protein